MKNKLDRRGVVVLVYSSMTSKGANCSRANFGLQRHGLGEMNIITQHQRKKDNTINKRENLN